MCYKAQLQMVKSEEASCVQHKVKKVTSPIFYSQLECGQSGMDKHGTLLQNMFILSAGKVSFVSTLQTDTIYTPADTKNNYWYRLA
jgi:hypothetical protein